MLKKYKHRLTFSGDREKIEKFLNLLRGENNLIDLKKIITLPYKTEKIKDFGYSWGRFYKKASFVVTFTTPCFPSPKPLERVIVQFPDVRVKWSVRVK